jgi:23S rRNA (uracil1939-C5)-methyltransferase
MLTAGQQLALAIEKPAFGGRMIARHEGQVVLVLGAIPGERVFARIDKADRQLALATTLRVLEASVDRRDPAADPLCGGCLYSHVAYRRQVRLKAELIEDAFARLGRIRLNPVQVAPSPERFYRMRGRLYVRNGTAGFYREGSHTICEALQTGLLSEEAVRIVGDVAGYLAGKGVSVNAIVVGENIPADQRALHLELEPGARLDAPTLTAIVDEHRLAGCSAQVLAGTATVVGDPAVSDPLTTITSGRAARGELRRRAQSFFQANRFLLPELVSTVFYAVLPEGPIVDLYAGVGLFAISLAAAGYSDITAVEGDPASGEDLAANASAFSGSVRVVQSSVEKYLAGARGSVGTVIVDPPRTGISRAAMAAVSSMGAPRVVYVSCDAATMARDARRLLDAGYQIESLRGFDLFPNTPHVESVGIFTRSAGLPPTLKLRRTAEALGDGG